MAHLEIDTDSNARRKPPHETIAYESNARQKFSTESMAPLKVDNTSDARQKSPTRVMGPEP